MTIPTDMDSEVHIDVDEERLLWLTENRRSNIIEVFEILKESENIERIWIRMAWADSSLRQLLNEGWTFTGALWLDVMRGTATGLDQLFSDQIIHGNLRPSNSSFLSKCLTET